jgi:hypothetical protein
VTGLTPVTANTGGSAATVISSSTPTVGVLIGLSNGININAAASPPTATAAGPGVGGTATVIDSSIAWACSNIGEVVHTSFAIPVHTVDTLTLTAHGITIFDTFNDEFFNAYMPFHYGGPALVTPYDEGALFVNFALFPRSYQPSGHLNISRARETYLKWTTSYISSNTPADLLCVARISKVAELSEKQAMSVQKHGQVPLPILRPVQRCNTIKLQETPKTDHYHPAAVMHAAEPQGNLVKGAHNALGMVKTWQVTVTPLAAWPEMGNPQPSVRDHSGVQFND